MRFAVLSFCGHPATLVITNMYVTLFWITWIRSHFSQIRSAVYGRESCKDLRDILTLTRRCYNYWGTVYKSSGRSICGISRRIEITYRIVRSIAIWTLVCILVRKRINAQELPNS